MQNDFEQMIREYLEDEAYRTMYEMSTIGAALETALKMYGNITVKECLNKLPDLMIELDNAANEDKLNTSLEREFTERVQSDKSKQLVDNFVESVIAELKNAQEEMDD